MGSDVLIVLVIVLAVVLIWQGPKNLPKLGSALGRSIKDFRSEVSSDETPSAPAQPASPEPPKDGSGG